MITKLDAARRQLDRAIHLLDEDDLSAHTLAFAAYCLLRDLIGPGALMDAIKDVEKALNITEIPHFLKHGDHHPEAILKEHSPETVHATMALTIRLWKENGYEPTITMSEFSGRPNPYEPGKRHHAAMPIIESGDIAGVAEITLSSTGGSPSGPERSPSPLILEIDRVFTAVSGAGLIRASVGEVGRCRAMYVAAVMSRRLGGFKSGVNFKLPRNNPTKSM